MDRSEIDFSETLKKDQIKRWVEEELVLPAPVFKNPVCAGAAYLAQAQTNERAPEPESDLLKSIRKALSSTTPIPHEAGHRTVSSGIDGDEELFWQDRTVIWSIGDVQKRKWVFDSEAKDQVLWACWANFPGDKFSPTSAAITSRLLNIALSAKRQAASTSTTDEDYIATFGRYSAIRPLTSREAAKTKAYAMSKPTPATVRCICIFLTSFVMMYTREGGVEYTANLPFHVRRVWELATGGVLIERSVAEDETEVDMLPTLFTLNGPYDEVNIAGFAHKITGGYSQSHGMQPDHRETSKVKMTDVEIIREPPDQGPLSPSVKTFSKSERIIYSSSEYNTVCNRILVSHDPVNHVVRIWRYVQEKSDPLSRAAARRLSQSRNIPLSDSLKTIPDVGPVGASTPTQETIAASLQLAKDTVNPGARKVSGIADIPPNSPLGRARIPSHARVTSNSRNELSITMDRMVLTGGSEEVRDHLGPRLVDDGRLQAEFWLSCIAEFDIEASGTPDGEVTAYMYDVRLNMGKMAILIPSQQKIYFFSIRQSEGLIRGTRIVSNETPAISMAPISAFRRHTRDLLYIRPNRSLGLITYDWKELTVRMAQNDLDDGARMADIEDPFTKATSLPVKLLHPVGPCVTVQHDDGHSMRLVVDFLTVPFVAQIFLALSQVLPPDITFLIRKRFLRRWVSTKKTTSPHEQFICCSEAIMEVVLAASGDTSAGETQRNLTSQFTSSAWQAMADSSIHHKISVDTAFRHLELPTTVEAKTVPSPGLSRVAIPSKITSPPEWASLIMQALHLFGESLKVSIGKDEELRMLAPLLVRLGRFTGIDWSNHWAVLAPEEPEAWAPITSYLFKKDRWLPVRPHDIFHYIRTRLNNTVPNRSGHFMPISQIHTPYRFRPSLEYGPIRVNNTSRTVLDAYMVLTNFKDMPNPRDRAKACVQLIHQSGLTADDVKQLPLGVAAPLMEAMKLCQEWPPMDWEPSIYTLIDRPDLAKMTSFSLIRTASGFGAAYRYKQEAVYKDERECIRGVVQQAKLAADGQAPVDIEASMANREFTDVRFGIDRRLREVDRMLQSGSITTVRILERPDINEHDLAKEQHQFAIVIAERTLALSLGRAMYSFGSLQMVDSDSFTIPKIDLSVRMVPHGVTITVDQSKMIPLESRIWGEFHNGVAAALRISRGAIGVDSTWIAFNRPNDLTAQHAGFILGLGLNGHLEGMYTWHTFSYLTPKHEMTTIAMLLGLSASYVGRGDLMVTKMLTVHTPALLPPGAAEMNLGLSTQMAGLMGIGVLYLGRKDRRMAEACLGEVGGRDFGSRLDVTNENKEAYCVTAALAFGLIMCGHGSKATSPADLDMINKLRVLVQGQPDAADEKQFRPVFGVNITSPAATIALGLMFMKTERADVASLFEIAHTPLALSRIPPNVLLIRALSRLLIMWDSITPTEAWVTTQVPKKMTDNEELEGYDEAVRDSYDLAYYNIVAGVCFAIALKYAGSADQQAETVLIHYYDAFSKTAGQPALTFDSQIKRSAVRDSLNLISICLGIVMSGTGEVNALRRLRYAHGQLMPYVKYGSHMTSHMALGLLFLGGGRFTVGTSNVATACMVAAFYPRWPNGSNDSKGLLPIFRHLWALAVEPRCLIARDADSGETVYLPVKIRLKEDDGIKAYQYTSPSLIPDFNRVVSITIDSPRYWPYWIDFDTAHPSRAAANVLHTQTIWVKRRLGYLGYGEDPRGNRSVFAFTGFRVGDTATMDFPRGTKEERIPIKLELDKFITSFSVDTRTIGFADRLCQGEPDTRLEGMVLSYCQQSLLECLLFDKSSCLRTLLNIFQMRYGTTGDGMTGNGLPALALKNLQLLSSYYAHVHNWYFGGRVGKDRSLRHPLIRASLTQAAVDLMDQRVQELRADEDFRQLFALYVQGGDCQVFLANLDTPTRLAVLRDLAFFINNEHIPGVEVAVAFASAMKQDVIRAKIAEGFAGVADEQRALQARSLVARTLLQTAHATHGWEMSSRSTDDVIDAMGL